MHRVLTLIFFFICVGCNGTDAGLVEDISEKDFKNENIRSIALTSSGKYFYAISSAGVVGKYQLSPFKKISSFQMPTPTVPFHRYKIRSLFVTRDEKILILYNPKGILLLDIETQEIIKTIEFENFSSGVVVDNHKIITLFAGKSKNKTLRNEWEHEKLYAPCTTEFRTYDAIKLNELSRSSYDEGVFCNERWHIDQNNALLVKIEGILLFLLEPLSGYSYPWTEKLSRLTIFDVETLEPLILVSYDRNSESNFMLSKDLTKLFIKNAKPYTGKAFSDTEYRSLNKTKSIIINLVTNKIEKANGEYDLSEKYSDLITVKNKRNVIQLYRTNGYITHNNRLINYQNKHEYYVYILRDGEAVLHDVTEKTFIPTEHAINAMKSLIK